MVSTHRILFPVDFSNYPFAVSPAVAKLIDRPNVEVILLHVIESRAFPASQLAQRMQMLDVLARRHFRQCAVRRRLDNGSPADRILDYISENEIEMVVMASRDSDGFGKGPLGRVATGVLRDAFCPVWLEWRNGKRQDSSSLATPRICCAIDGTRSPEQLLREAVVVADQIGGDLTIVSVVQPRPYDSATLSRGLLDVNEELLRETRRIEKLKRRIAPSAEVMVAGGWCEAIIGRAVRERRASLLITGDCRQAVLSAEATCPVLRLPHGSSGAFAHPIDHPAEHRRVA